MSDRGLADPHPWRGAVLLALLVVVIGMTWTVVLLPSIRGVHGYATPADVWIPMKAAHFIADGAYAYQYESTPFFVATPMFPLVISPIAGLSEALRLTEGGPPIPAPYPQLWWIYGPIALGSSVVLLAAVRRLDAVVSTVSRSGPVLPQVATVALVVVPTSVVYGHFEDVLALALVLISIRSLLAEGIMAGGLALGFAVGFKQWAVLGVPLFVMLAPTGERRKAAFWSLFPPVAMVATPLLLNWSDASKALLHARSFTSFGRPQVWVSRVSGSVGGTPERALLVMLSVGVAWALRRSVGARQVLGAFGVVFLARVLLEPTAYAYYLAPALILLLLAERAAGRTGWRSIIVGGALMVLFVLRLPLVVWWPCCWALLAVLVAPAIRDFQKRSRRFGALGD